MFEGILPAMVTPVKDAHVDHEALRGYVDWLLAQRIDGLFALGTTGEGQLLSRAAWVQAMTTIAKAVDGRKPVIAQCGGISLEETLYRIDVAVSLGADAIAVLAPYYYAYDEDALARYFSTVFQRWPHVNFFLYNIPRCTHNDITPDLVARLASEFGNVVGIKDSSGSAELLRRFTQTAPHLAVFTGSEGLMREAFEAGAKGLVSGMASALPNELRDAWDATRSGDLAPAERIQRVQAIFQRYSTIPAAKAILARRGLMSADCIPPILSLTEGRTAELFADLQAEGITL
ncbi:MAG: dihydrodipicolinate synthase family protein [Thermoflavifilum sp.]|nr:dihydrodipicolinate synthase family protein [Thermoflavifilum sp.]MCL6515011.1 dihydrodipicolinate synthase family protein [Alicyclobacillus sp.]